MKGIGHQVRVIRGRKSDPFPKTVKHNLCNMVDLFRLIEFNCQQPISKRSGRFSAYCRRVLLTLRRLCSCSALRWLNTSGWRFKWIRSSFRAPWQIFLVDWFTCSGCTVFNFELFGLQRYVSYVLVITPMRSRVIVWRDRSIVVSLWIRTKNEGPLPVCIYIVNGNCIAYFYHQLQ